MGLMGLPGALSMNESVRSLLRDMAALSDDCADKLHECFTDSNALDPDTAIAVLPVIINALANLARGIHRMIELPQ